MENSDISSISHPAAVWDEAKMLFKEIASTQHWEMCRFQGDVSSGTFYPSFLSRITAPEGEVEAFVQMTVHEVCKSMKLPLCGQVASGRPAGSSEGGTHGRAQEGLTDHPEQMQLVEGWSMQLFPREGTSHTRRRDIERTRDFVGSPIAEAVTPADSSHLQGRDVTVRGK